MRPGIPTALFGLLGALACGLPDTGRPVDTACDTTDQCEAGLECLPYGDHLGICENVGFKCSRSCTTDADCGALGAGYFCLKACDDTFSCGFVDES